MRANRVLIADDSAAVRADLRALLDLLDDVEVVGESGAASDVLPATHRCAPDIVIVDLDMGTSRPAEMDGLGAIRELKRELPGTAVFVLTIHGYPDAKRAALRAGADAFYVKGVDTDRLLSAVKIPRAGGTGTRPHSSAQTQSDEER